MAQNDMQSESMAGSKPTASTQEYLDIAEIKEDTVILKNGSLRAVLVVSSTNFSLKSVEEQNALISAYQNFLNGLEFPLQILMHSRKLDIHSYLDKLQAVMQQQTNELLRLQTQEYIEYIGKLIEFASIMTKTFYVVVPLSTEATKEGVFSWLTNLINPATKISGNQQNFDLSKEELSKRVNQVASGLGSMGLKTIVLNTEELVELMYNSYNLSNASPIKIKNIDDLELTGTK
ncbi:MAG TPA: hypothetical protein VL306_00965 [Methylomirabilota bacterium]|jgi:type IV secretory pathway VirB4 component|nr:hypothetical protein [Methylomirabilota bacterium]